MTVSTLPPQIRFQPFGINSSGAIAPIPGGTVYFYAAGSTTPQAVYDGAGTSLGTSLVLDANGGTDFRLGTGLSYKIDVKDALGAAVIGWPVDNIDSSDKVLLAAIAAFADTASVGNGDALIGVKSTLTNGLARTQHDKNADWVSAGDFVGATDLLKVTAAIAAIKAGTGKGTIVIPGDMEQTFDVPLLNLSAGQAICILDLRPYHGIVDTNVAITAAAASGSDIVITAATLARPSVITVAVHGLTAGQTQKMTISGATGNTAINGYHAVTYVSATQLSVDCDATTMAALTGSPVIKAPTIITTAAHGLVSGQVTEITISGSGTSNLDGTWEATYASPTTLSLQIPIGTAYVAGATIKYLNTSFRGSFGGVRVYSEGKDGSSGYATEFVIAGKQNPGLVLDCLSDGTASGYTNSNRGASVVVRKNGVGYWQLLSDPVFNGADIWSFQHLLGSKQLLTMHGNGFMTYGQKATGMDYTVPVYTHNFRGQNYCFENSSGNLGFIWRLSDNTKRKIWTFDTTNDKITVGNTANTTNIWGVDDNGFILQTVGANVASATTIAPTGSIFHVTGTTAIVTITPPYTGFKGSITIIPDGLFTMTNAGNIAIAVTAVVSKALVMTFDYNTSKWYPSYTS